MRERLSDYEKICASLDLPKQMPLKPHQKGKGEKINLIMINICVLSFSVSL